MPWTKTFNNRTEFDKALKDAPGLRGVTYKEAIREATAQLLSTDNSVFVIGEGVDDSGGVFGTTKGLQEEFGRPDSKPRGQVALHVRRPLEYPARYTQHYRQGLGLGRPALAEPAGDVHEHTRASRDNAGYPL